MRAWRSGPGRTQAMRASCLNQYGRTGNSASPGLDNRAVRMLLGEVKSRNCRKENMELALAVGDARPHRLFTTSGQLIGRTRISDSHTKFSYNFPRRLGRIGNSKAWHLAGLAHFAVRPHFSRRPITRPSSRFFIFSVPECPPGIPISVPPVPCSPTEGMDAPPESLPAVVGSVRCTGRKGSP